MERLEPSWVTAASTESHVPSANLSTACPACQTPPTARGAQESARRGAVSSEVVLGIGCEAVTQGRNCPASPDPGAELKVSEVAHPRLRRDPPRIPLLSTTVSLKRLMADAHRRDRAVLAPTSTPEAGTLSRWSPAHAVQDALGAPRGVKPLGRRAGRRKASDSGGKCASRSAARKAYAAMQSAA
jgi:hypothetical protein